MSILWKTFWFWVSWKRKKHIRKKRINEIKRLNEDAEIKKDELLDDLLEVKNKICKLLTDFEYEKHSVLNDIAVLESKLIKLEISPGRTDRIKNSVLSF